MATTQDIDWTDVEGTAKALAGAWRDMPCFCWHRGYELEDADSWMLWYTSSRDAGLLEQSNEKAITDRLRPFSEGATTPILFSSATHIGRWDTWTGFRSGFTDQTARSPPHFRTSAPSRMPWKATRFWTRPTIRNGNTWRRWRITAARCGEKRTYRTAGSRKSTPGSATTAWTSSPRTRMTRADLHHGKRSWRRFQALGLLPSLVIEA